MGNGDHHTLHTLIREAGVIHLLPASLDFLYTIIPICIVRQLMRFALPAHSFSRKTNFCTLPVEVFGKLPNSTLAGHLKCARRSRQNAMISASVALCSGFKATNALGRSPHYSSGIATTAHSSTAWCCATVCSTSMGEIFS